LGRKVSECDYVKKKTEVSQWEHTKFRCKSKNSVQIYVHTVGKFELERHKLRFITHESYCCGNLAGNPK